LRAYDAARPTRACTLRESGSTAALLQQRL